jgi:hypothetical protein
MHPMEPAGPAECVTVLAQTMASMQYETQCHLPGYVEWMNGADHGSAYAHHRKVLQLLQWRSPGERWNLKTPGHLLALGPLLDTYPDARLIWTHRDPADVVTSVASLNCALQSIMSDQVDPRVLGPFWQDRLATLVERAMATLDDRPDTRITHVDYQDLVDAPVDTATAVYEQLGLPIDDLTRRRMQAWMDANPQNRWGRHRYDLAEFALDPDGTRERFRTYVDRFGVA